MSGVTFSLITVEHLEVLSYCKHIVHIILMCGIKPVFALKSIIVYSRDVSFSWKNNVIIQI